MKKSLRVFLFLSLCLTGLAAHADDYVLKEGDNQFAAMVVCLVLKRDDS